MPGIVSFVEMFVHFRSVHYRRFHCITVYDFRIVFDYAHRYLARALLIPFVYEPPSIRVDTLDVMLSDAHKALPQAVALGNWLKSLSQTELHNIVQDVQETLGGKMDGRLALQYALTILCAKE